MCLARGRRGWCWLSDGNSAVECRESAHRALRFLNRALALGNFALNLHGEVRIEPRDERLVRGGREQRALAVWAAEIRLVDSTKNQPARTAERRVRREGVIARYRRRFIRGQ